MSASASASTNRSRNGRGKLKIEDSIWEIVGLDAPAGAWVIVTGVDGLRLQVAPQEDGGKPTR